MRTIYSVFRSRTTAFLIPMLCIMLVLFISGCTQPSDGGVNESQARKMAVAGTFYPDDADELKEWVTSFLSKVPEQKLNGSILGLVSPHAGYVYSGQVAAYGYKKLEGEHFHTVIILGPSHHVYFKGASIYNQGYYKTPLGLVEIGSSLASDIMGGSDKIGFSAAAHEKEHSVEVQVPFLQEVLGDGWNVVPIVTGDISADELADAIVPYLDDGILVVASSDLSHYHPYNEAIALDKICTDAISSVDISMMDECELCGRIPVLTLMKIAEKQGWNATLLEYKNSGDVSGDKSRVVGYTSVAFYKPNLTQEERGFLLDVARNSIETYLKNGTMIDVQTDNQNLTRTQGVFVTLTKKGQLRGCIGHILPVQELYLDVRDNAINAAVNDPRFPKVTLNELNDVHIEVSVLTVPALIRADEPQDYLDFLVIGKHGLIMKKGWNQGVLLPQVPVEWGWDEVTFLEQTCNKAGMERDCWKDSNTEVYQFSAEVFSEGEV